MATEQELLIKINTLSNTIGLEKTAAALESMAVKAQASNKTVAATAQTVGKKTAEAAQQGADGLNVMSAATAALNGNFAGAASAAVPLITKLQVLKGAITSVSLVAAGLTVLYTAFSKISEYAAKAAEAVASYNAKARADMIEAVTNAYNRQAIAMERISKIRDAELERLKAENEANKEYEIALTRQAKLKELQATTDESKRAEIESKYGRIEQQITGKYDASSEAAEYERMKKRELELWQASEAKSREIIQKRALLKRTEKGAAEADSAAEDLALQPWGVSGQIDAKKKEAEKARQDAEVQRKELEKLEQDRTALADEARRVGGLRPSAQRRMAAAAASRGNDVLAMDIADTDRSRANQETMYESAQRVDEALATYSEADQRFVTALLQSAKLRGDLTNKLLQDTEKWLRDNQARQRNM